MAEKKEKQYVSDNAQLMAEWNWEKNNELGFDPHKLSVGSERKVWWKCSKGHTWEAVCYSRVAGNKCPICSGRKVLSGYNDLSTLHPNIALQWHPTKNGTLTTNDYNHGFKYVECDVQFTLDGIPVLLHDDTIDRTSNGTGYLSQMTYAQVSQYDFSYDDSDTTNDFSAYRGEKIPTFKEFIALCKELSLHPYIEIKGNMTDSEAKTLIKIVADADMIDCVSWLGFSGDALSKIAANCPTARLVWVITDTNGAKIKANNIPFAQMNLMTGQNQVVFDIWYTLATQDVVDVVKEVGIPLEVWTCNDINAIKNLHPYVTGVSSDYYNAKEVLKNAGIER